MKTNKFEEILRQKLESLTPDFQEKDWNKFQAFQQHATPSFWQSYGHWLGYAVAVATTAVMVLLYVGQSRQNDALLGEMQELRQQIKVIADSAAMQSDAYKQGTPAPIEPEATTEDNKVVGPSVPLASESLGRGRAPASDASTSQTSESVRTEEQFQEKKAELTKAPISNDIERRLADKPVPTDRETSVPTKPDRPTEETPESLVDLETPTRIDLGKVAPLPRVPFSATQNSAFRPLTDRIPQSTYPTLLAATTSGTTTSQKREAVPESAVKPQTSRQKTEKRVAKNRRQDEAAATRTAVKAEPAAEPEKVVSDESLLPKFGLGLPYRVGLSQRWEGRTRAFGIQSEFILGEHWSLRTGLAWLKPPVQRFLSERKFNDDMKEDFRKKNGKRIPLNAEVYGIETRTTVVQVPLGLSFRHDFGQGFAYFVGVGTNLSLSARQDLSFQFRRPNREFGEESFTRKVPVSVFNNLNVSLGLEKRWSPIVLQVSPLLNTRFRTSPFLRTRTNVGLQVNLLYEFGGK